MAVLWLAPSPAGTLATWGSPRLDIEGWEAVVGDLAEGHADELEGRVAELRVLARSLRAPNGEPW